MMPLASPSVRPSWPCRSVVIRLPSPTRASQTFGEPLPELTKSFLLLSERDDVDILDEAATDEVDEPQVVEDEMHTHVSVTVKGFCLTGRNPLNLSRHMNFRKERLYPRFFRALRASFATDYNIRGIVAFKDRRLRWKQRLAFNDQCVFP